MRLLSKLFALAFIVLLISCGKSDYDRLVTTELGKNVRMDSIVWNVFFGDSQKEFYAVCWELNKQGIIGHGPENQHVMYKMKGASPHVISMLYYPEFDSQDRLKRMDMKFFYDGWSPGTKKFSSDSLLPVVMDSLEQWYGGNEFIEVVFDEDPQKLHVKMDGNRRITVHADQSKFVIVRVTDMLNEEN